MSPRCKSCGCENSYQDICQLKGKHRLSQNVVGKDYNFKKGLIKSVDPVIQKVSYGEFCDNCDNNLAYNKYEVSDTNSCSNCGSFIGEIKEVKVKDGAEMLIVNGTCENCNGEIYCHLKMKESLLSKIGEHIL